MAERNKSATPSAGSTFGGQTAMRVSRFAFRLLQEWKSLDLPFEDARVVIGVSGGADSVALFLALKELVQKEKLFLDLIAAHFNHGIREEAKEDATWVKTLTEGVRSQESGVRSQKSEVKSKGQRTNVGFVLGEGDVLADAKKNKDNLEQSARRARYDFLFDVAIEKKALIVLTAHTMDDQAETVLLRLIRGSGTDGLGGIEPIQKFKIQNPKSKNTEPKEQKTKNKRQEINPKSKIQNPKLNDVFLVRPFLSWARRGETEEFCRECGVDFLVDSMNEDLGFARVRVRKELLPLLRKFNGRIVESLVRTAEILRDDNDEIDLQADKLLLEASDEKETSVHAPLSVNVLLRASRGLRRRALRLWIERGKGDLRRVCMSHILQIEKLLEGEQGGRIVVLPGGFSVERRRGKIFPKHKKSDK